MGNRLPADILRPGLLDVPQIIRRGRIVRQEPAGDPQQQGLFLFRQAVDHAYQLLSDW